MAPIGAGSLAQFERRFEACLSTHARRAQVLPERSRPAATFRLAFFEDVSARACSRASVVLLESAPYEHLYLGEGKGRSAIFL